MKKHLALQVESQEVPVPLLQKLLPFQLDLELPIEGYHFVSVSLPCSLETIEREMTKIKHK